MKYDLVFEGGGAKGIVFVGALQALEERGHTFQRLIGTSAGAITATLMAAGYDSAGLYQAVTEQLSTGKPVFSTFMDIPESFADSTIEKSLTYTIFNYINIPFVPDFLERQIDRVLIQLLMRIPAYRQTFAFIERGGLYAGDTFLQWLGSKLSNKNLAPEITFSQFYECTGKDLSFIASNTSIPQMLILNHRTTPQCPVIWGARMSMSIPFLWEEVIWQEAWGPYYPQGPNYPGQRIAGDSIVDGGILSNFPIKLLLHQDPETTNVMGEPTSDHVLGLLIDEQLEVPGAVADSESDSNFSSHIDFKRLRMVQRVSRLINTMIKGHDVGDIRQHADKVCRLPAKGYGITEFDMNPARRQALINAGKMAMRQYLDKVGQ